MSKKKKILVGVGILLLILILAGILLWRHWPRLVAGNLGSGDPWIDSDLKENIKANMATSPKDDFHLWVNYDWLKENKIPDGYTSYTASTVVQDETDQKAMALFDDPSVQGHDADLIRALYHAYLDWNTRNAAGVEPLRATIKDIESISSIEELNVFLCDPERSFGVPALISFWNTPSLSDSSRYITRLSYDGFLLQDPGEYQNQTITARILKIRSWRFFSYLMGRLGYSGTEVRHMLRQTMNLEAELASVCMTADEVLSPDYLRRINNEYSLADAAALASDYPLERILSANGYGAAERLLISEPAYITELGKLYIQDTLDAIKSRMIVHYVINQAGALDRKSFDMLQKVNSLIYGTKGSLSDEKYAYYNVSGWLCEPVERCYLEAYQADEAKERITNLCYEILDYYRTMLAETDWLSEATRAAAIDKLDHITVNVAYPDKWQDYTTLSLDGLNYRECRQRISAFDDAQNAAKTNQPVERGYWDMNTLDANAFYNPQDNSINILLGILGGDFYRDGMSDEELLGGIGAVIGHEISHAFDTSGAQFDANGSMTNWWSEEDYATFRDRAARLIEYYDTINPFGRHHADGTTVQTEAIADITGLKCMLALAKDKPDFDYEAFFTQFARIWRRLASIQSEYILLNYDKHPLGYLRTNVSVQQFEEFMDAFSVQPGDKMYLAPEDRISVW